jgi:hypothetical protein
VTPLDWIGLDGLKIVNITGCAAVGCTNRDVVGFDAEHLQAFLHIDANGTAATPQADDKGRAESTFNHLHAQLE